MKDVGQDKKWGDQICLLVSSLLLGCAIKVISIAGFDVTFGKGERTLYIGHFTNLHFVRLEEMPCGGCFNL